MTAPLLAAQSLRSGYGRIEVVHDVDLTVVGKFAEHAIERGAIRVFGAEGARDLPDADLAAAFADEGDKFLA